MSVRLRDLEAADFDRAKALLAAHDMPSAGMGSADSLFVAAFDDAELVGLAGLDLGAGAALLRSLIVVQPRRQGGIGAALIDHLTARAWSMGARRLYLFVTEREARFPWLGWQRVTTAEAAENLPAAPLIVDFAARGHLATAVAFRYDFD